MSHIGAENPIDPLLADWIEERGAGDAETARPLLPADRELLRLFSEIEAAVPGRMSETEARETLAAVRRRAGSSSPSPRRIRDAVLAAAAVVAGLAIGLAALRPRQPGLPVSEIIKKVSFESTHEGRVVRLQLELSRVR